MSRPIGKLSPLAVRNMKGKGLYGDGGGLYLQVSRTESKSWIFRYMIHGKAKSMGLGPLHAISLADAREKAAGCRKMLVEGIEPQTQKKIAQAQAKLAAARTMSFQKCAEAYIEAHKVGWKNAKHIWQWSNSLQKYVYPTIGQLAVQDVDVTFVMRVLTPIWEGTNETAARIRGRIESILDWAKTNGYREGENPARWKGHLENLLAAPSKIQKVKHHPALPYKEIAVFMERLERNHPGTASQALKLVILCATRTGEGIGARWNEFNMDEKTWTIPAERMKMAEEHRVPLSEPAMKVLRPLYQAHLNTTNCKPEDLVFEGQKRGKPLSNMSLLMLLRRMGRDDLTVHGFRSTFRDWTAEQTSYPREVAEAALAHAITNKVEAAYRRTDLFDKRRKMMDDWGAYCVGVSGS